VEKRAIIATPASRQYKVTLRDGVEAEHELRFIGNMDILDKMRVMD
jgi:hypothetical protein